MHAFALHTVCFSTKQSGLNSVKTGLFCWKANIVIYVTMRGAGSIWNGIVIYNPSWHEIEHVYFKVFLQVMALLCMYVYTVCVSASYMCVCARHIYARLLDHLLGSHAFHWQEWLEQSYAMKYASCSVSRWFSSTIVPPPGRSSAPGHRRRRGGATAAGS